MRTTAVDYGARDGSAALRRPLLGSLLVATVALVGVLAPVQARADVEDGDLVWIGAKEGYGGTGLHPVFVETPTDPSDPGVPDYYAYCIEQAISAEVDILGQVGERTSFLGANYFSDPEIQGKVLWVIAHSYPALSLEEFGAAAGVPGISRNDAIEATQYALWRYTDLDFDAPWAWETPDSEAAYWYLVDGANASTGMSSGDFEVSVTLTGPSGPFTAGSLAGPFVVSTNQPTASVTTDPVVLITDAAGTPVDAGAVSDGDELYLDLRGVTTSGSTQVTASVAGIAGAGMIVSVPTAPGGEPTSADHAQTLLLVGPYSARTSAQETVSWSASATPTASDDERLPDTGLSEETVPPALAALIAVLLGAGLVLFGRRPYPRHRAER